MAWRQFHGGPANAGFALRPSDAALHLDWEVEVGPFGTGSPVVDSEGVVYVLTALGELVAIDPGGDELWRRGFGQGAFASPALSADGSIYLIVNQHQREPTESFPFQSVLMGASPDGHFRWGFTFPDGGFTTGAPKVWDGPDGTFVIAYVTRHSSTGAAGELWVLNSDGEVVSQSGPLTCPRKVTGHSPLDPIFDGIADAAGAIWDFITNIPVEFDGSGLPFPLLFADPTPAIVDAPNVTERGEALIAFADNMCHIGMRRFDGTRLEEVWSHEHDFERLSSPAVTAAGQMLVGSAEGKVQCFDVLTGTVLWTYDAGESVLATPAGFARPIVIVSQKQVHLVDANGGMLDRGDLGGSTHASPAVSAEWIYVAHANELVSYGLTGLNIRAHADSRAALSSPAIGPQGAVYATHRRDVLRAYRAPEPDPFDGRRGLGIFTRDDLAAG